LATEATVPAILVPTLIHDLIIEKNIRKNISQLINPKAVIRTNIFNSPNIEISTILENPVNKTASRITIKIEVPKKFRISEPYCLKAGIK
jgi:hypothetical protein